MQIINTLDNSERQPLALTIGNFDGVHLGHQTILQTVVDIARAEQVAPAVMTFCPHAKVFFGNARDFLITSDAEKAELMAQQHIARLYHIPFTADFAQMSAEDFVDALIHRLHVKHLLVGDDFRFGYRGQGDFALLTRMCQQHGVSLASTPTITYQGERISSSRVRQAIKASNFLLVQQLLGRELRYTGKVITGKQLGRTIAFPTANVQLPRARLLPDGVFAVKIHIEGEVTPYYGMSNIGTKPTVDNSNTRQIETHIFDFTGDLYHKTLSITPVKKLRDEVKFSGVDALIQQLHRDKANALAFFT